MSDKDLLSLSDEEIAEHNRLVRLAKTTPYSPPSPSQTCCRG